MKTKILCSLLMAAAIFFMPPASNSLAATLTVGGAEGPVGSTLKIPIVVDQANLIASAAFTVNFPVGLTVEVESVFFDTFQNQFIACGLSQEEIDAVLAENDTGYDQPLVFNLVRGNQLLISAARCQAAGEQTNATILTLKVTGNTPGTFPITITPTRLNNTAAGYAAEGEQIDLLVGSDTTKEITDPAAFPVLLAAADFEANVTNGQAVFTAIIETTTSIVETTTGSVETTTEPGETTTEAVETTTSLETTTTTSVIDTTSTTTSGVVETTTVSLIQQIIRLTPVPETPDADSAFTVAIDYKTSDGQDATGMMLMVYYDSTKVGFVNHDSLFQAGVGLDEPTLHDDIDNLDNDPATDKYIAMSWTSDTPSWPNHEMPLRLVNLNFAYICGETIIRAAGLPGRNENDQEYVFLADNEVSLTASCVDTTTIPVETTTIVETTTTVETTTMPVETTTDVITTTTEPETTTTTTSEVVVTTEPQTTTTTTTTTVPAPIPGDVDGNREVTVTDAVLALQVIVGIVPNDEVFGNADVNGNERIGIEEVIYILKEVAETDQ